MALYSELKRRNVLKVAVLYVVATWLILQVADAGIPALGLPVWTREFILLLLAIGFPVALIFSWVYEITPEGLKKELDVDQTQSIVYKTGQKLNAAVAVLLVLGLAGLVAERLLPETGPVRFGRTLPDPSIAILPFDDVSPDGAQAYLAVGLSDELTSLLVRVPGLRVSVTDAPFAAAHVLMGGSRKDADEIHISAKLVSADDGAVLWSKTFDRAFADVFLIQDEIAQAVIDALDMELPIHDVPTAKRYGRVAFGLYLQAGPLWSAASVESRQRAFELLSRAVELDPNFGPAWVKLAYTQISLSAGADAAYPMEYDEALPAFLRGALLGEASAVIGQGWVAIAARQDMRRGFDYFRFANEIARPDDRIVRGATMLMCQLLGAPEQSLASDATIMSLLGMERREDVILLAAEHASNDDIAGAFELLESAASAPTMITLRLDASTRFANLVGNPRWDALLMRHGLHDSQRPAGLCDFP